MSLQSSLSRPVAQRLPLLIDNFNGAVDGTVINTRPPSISNTGVNWSVQSSLAAEIYDGMLTTWSTFPAGWPIYDCGVNPSLMIATFILPAAGNEFIFQQRADGIGGSDWQFNFNRNGMNQLEWGKDKTKLNVPGNGEFWNQYITVRLSSSPASKIMRATCDELPGFVFESDYTAEPEGGTFFGFSFAGIQQQMFVKKLSVFQ